MNSNDIKTTGDKLLDEWLETASDLDPADVFSPAVNTRDKSDTETLRAYGNTRSETAVNVYPHKCERCDGTGVYTFGYVQRRAGKCFACNGKGGFKTSAAARRKARQARTDKKERTGQANLDLFARHYPAEYAYLNGDNGTNEFKVSVLHKVKQYGSLTDNTMAALQKGIVREAQWAAERKLKDAAAPRFDPKPMLDAFETATKGASGLRRPTLRTEHATFTLAPAGGKNPGCVYVKHNGDYLGKITPQGALHALNSVSDKQKQHIIDAAQNPLDAALSYGRATGKCSCCGRTLTNETSIDLGIGPICRDRWGL